MAKNKDIITAGAMVTAISSAISEGFKLLSQVISGAERRRMRKGIEIGEKMALRVKELKLRDKELKKLSDDFFKYNN